MATPVWSDAEKRWTLRIQRDGVSRKFSSVKPGPAGKREILSRAREWEYGSKSDKVTIASEWEKFLSDVQMRSSSENFRNIELNGRLYILPSVGRMRISHLRATDWQGVINNATGKDGRQLAKKSLSNIRATIISFLRFANMDGVVDLIPQGLYVPKSAPIKGKEILQKEQSTRLFSEFDHEWYINLWRFLLVTGMRPGEAMGLQWSDIHDDALTIRRSINARGSVTDGKNANARRTIVLHNTANDILSRQKQRTALLRSEWIFPNRNGDKPLQSVAYKEWRRIAWQLGTKASPYSLRHTFISYMLNEMSLRFVQDYVGHSPKMDTSRTYGHDVDGVKEQTAKKIDLALRRKLS